MSDAVSLNGASSTLDNQLKQLDQMQKSYTAATVQIQKIAVVIGRLTSAIEAEIDKPQPNREQMNIWDSKKTALEAQFEQGQKLLQDQLAKINTLSTIIALSVEMG